MARAPKKEKIETPLEGLLIKDLKSVEKKTKDFKEFGKVLDKRQARILANMYYLLQDERKRFFSQVEAYSKDQKPHSLIAWLGDQTELLEKNIYSALDAFSAKEPMGIWAREIRGIGPVLSSGLIAHIDISKCPTAGHIWSYAGLDPTKKWGKGEKRPWNADLKVLCWKIGDCLIKHTDKPGSTRTNPYRPIYDARKKYEQEKNDAGEYKEIAKEKYAAFVKNGVKKDEPFMLVYESGRLPDGHIHARCLRYMVKIFLSHWFEVAYYLHHKERAPKPFALAILGHAHMIEVPNAPWNDVAEAG